MVTAEWTHGDHTGLPFPACAASLHQGGTSFLTKAFRRFGALGDDNEVVRIVRLEDVSGGSTGRKAILDVEYGRSHPDLPQQLFVKFSRDFDDPLRDLGRTQMESEVRFATLTRSPDFPIVVPATLFADYHRESGTGTMICERIPFGTRGFEPQYHKCLDYEMPGQLAHYRALLTTVARLAGTHRAGRLPEHLVAEFPVDLQAATVGDKASLTAEQLDRRVARLADFTDTHPGLFAANLRSVRFAERMTAEAHELVTREADVWRHLRDAHDYIALCHWNANVDNAWFWTVDDTLSCGLMDWGCVSQMNVAMAIWGALSGAETELWDGHLDELLVLFCEEVSASGGPILDATMLRRQLVLYATMMGVTWLLDVPALLSKRIPDIGPQTTRMDPRLKHDEGLRAPLQMLINVLNLWETRGLDESLALLG